MNLYQHQQNILNDDPARTGLFLGTGSGKTRIALSLARGNTLVIAPKTQVEDGNWGREWTNIDDHYPMEDISKEAFRRDYETLPRYDTVIVDEAHTCLGVTPNVRYIKGKAIPKTSQLFEALGLYLMRTQPDRLYLCTATIMRSPMTVWGAGKLLGHEWNWYEFREVYYVKLPMPGREVWVPKSDDATKDRLAKAVKGLGYVGRLEDFFDVPEQTFRTVSIDLAKQQKDRIKDMRIEFPEPLVRVGKVHQIENGGLAGNEFSKPEYFDNGKIDKILELAEEFPKMVIFARYKTQIQQIITACDKASIPVLVMTGETKNRGELIGRANDMKSCIFVAQSQISAGWELPDFPVMVFASKTSSFVDYDQALGRIQRANNIKKNLYISLVTKPIIEGKGKERRTIGGVDESVDRSVSNKQDFNERLYAETHDL